ncbi:hypothetical protein [Permianibacter aggregans]|uniref:Fimbrial protein n=1 Tax=Permianibacter aggregans TaxID=1510150 RepID=A0A4R6V089_9GAMM|nr:hypothetical protein [Permianibacter aggregans]QGX41536.1 hypothetical protein E2H98_18425 [Permianibacter aggregans]TDQ51335.1 hypothetical protein EV696_101309 [Permianibacter aggregans]
MNILMRFGLVFFLGFSSIANAYVWCKDAPVPEIGGALTSSFHGLNNGGATGSVIFISMSRSHCGATNGEDISKGIYLVIDDIGNTTSPTYELKRTWISMILAAKASNKTIDLHGNTSGASNAGYAVVKPYFLSAD